MLLKEIKEILGGDISTKNSKMPGTSFGLSTDYCNVGGKLRAIEGSVCSKCYAARLEKFRPSVKKGWTRRAEAVHRASISNENRNLWVKAMVERLTKLAPTHHRWHDSGDLQGAWHLSMIISVAQECPDIQFWIPTKERAIVKRAQKALEKFGGIPDNLTIRVSAAQVGDKLSHEENSSMVFNDRLGHPDDIWACPAKHQGGTCANCRACWDKSIKIVGYPLH